MVNGRVVLDSKDSAGIMHWTGANPKVELDLMDSTVSSDPQEAIPTT